MHKSKKASKREKGLWKNGKMHYHIEKNFLAESYGI